MSKPLFIVPSGVPLENLENLPGGIITYRGYNPVVLSSEHGFETKEQRAVREFKEKLDVRVEELLDE